MSPERVDQAIVAAVRAAGGQAAAPAFDHLYRGCQPLPGQGRACGHVYGFAGGVILVDIFPHRVINAKGPVTFHGSDIDIDLASPREATSLAQ